MSDVIPMPTVDSLTFNLGTVEMPGENGWAVRKNDGSMHVTLHLDYEGELMSVELTEQSSRDIRDLIMRRFAS